MSEGNGKVVPVDMGLFQTNRRKADRAVLLAHGNQHVAWNGTGTTILASKPTDEELFAELDRIGIRVDQVVIEWIPDPGMVYL